MNTFVSEFSIKRNMIVKSVCFHENLMFYGDHSHAKGIDVNTMEEIFSVYTSHFVDRIKVSSDGKTLFISSIAQKDVTIWNVETEKLIKSIAGPEDYKKKDDECAEYINEIALAGADEILIGRADGEIHHFNWRTGERIAIHRGHTKDVLALVYNPKHARIFSGSSDGLLMSWETLNNRRKVLFRDDDFVRDVCAIDEDTVATAHNDGKIRMWDTGTLTLKSEISNSRKNNLTALAVSFCGRYLAYGQTNSVLKMFDLATKSRYKIKLWRDIKALALSPGGRFVAFWLSNAEFHLMAIDPALSSASAVALETSESKEEAKKDAYVLYKIVENGRGSGSQ